MRGLLASPYVGAVAMIKKVRRGLLKEEPIHSPIARHMHGYANQDGLEEPEFSRFRHRIDNEDDDDDDVGGNDNISISDSDYSVEDLATDSADTEGAGEPNFDTLVPEKDATSLLETDVVVPSAADDADADAAEQYGIIAPDEEVVDIDDEDLEDLPFVINANEEDSARAQGDEGAENGGAPSAVQDGQEVHHARQKTFSDCFGFDSNDGSAAATAAGSSAESDTNLAEMKTSAFIEHLEASNANVRAGSLFVHAASKPAHRPSIELPTSAEVEEIDDIALSDVDTIHTGASSRSEVVLEDVLVAPSVSVPPDLPAMQLPLAANGASRQYKAVNNQDRRTKRREARKHRRNGEILAAYEEALQVQALMWELTGSRNRFVSISSTMTGTSWFSRQVECFAGMLLPVRYLRHSRREYFRASLP
jgi:hypothetical protein